MTCARSLVCLWLLLGTAGGSEASNPIRAWLIANYADGTAEPVSAVVAGQVYPNATLIAAKSASVKLHARDLDGDLPWSLLGDDGICVLAENLVPKAPVEIREAWLLLAIVCKRVETPAFVRLRDDLVLKEPAAAARVKAAMSAPVAAKGGNKPAPTDAATPVPDPATPAAASTAGGASVGDKAQPPATFVADEDDGEFGPMLDKSGKVIRSAYVKWACDYSAQGVSLRLGPTADKFKAKVEKKTIYQPPKQFFKGMRNNQGGPWTIGGPPTADPGDYSRTQAQILYVPDSANDPGVDRLDILGMGHHVFDYCPAPCWWGGWHPEPTLATAAWHQANPKGLGSPVGLARGYGNWCNSAVIPFTSGLIGTAGTCTSQNAGTFLQLPPGKMPTAIALTSRNEFALVTIWDLAKLKGEIAVIALECCHTDGLMALYSWHQRNPCLPSVGGFTSMKLMGYVELPFATPTSIAAMSDRPGGQWLHLNGKNAQAGDLDLGKQEVRDTFGRSNGENATFISTAGFAVVASRFENKVAFIDLQPLFQHVGEMYCTTQARYDRTRDYGPGPKQWPCDFSVDDKPKPVVVKTVRVKAPTAVWVAQRGDPNAHACIASEDGMIHIWRVGGLATDAPAPADDIRKGGEVQVGKNPTCIAYSKNLGWGGPETIMNELIVVCRGERDIEWVHIEGDSGTVTRRLRDSRLKDPVHAEVADNHGTESHVLTVMDFMGRQVINYRFGPVIFHTNGGARYEMGPDGKDEFECGGSMEYPGYPYAVCGANVN